MKAIKSEETKTILFSDIRPEHHFIILVEKDHPISIESVLIVNNEGQRVSLKNCLPMIEKFQEKDLDFYDVYVYEDSTAYANKLKQLLERVIKNAKSEK